MILKPRWFYVLLFALSTLAGCTTLQQVATMNTTDIQKVSDSNLCQASAMIKAGHEHGQLPDLSSFTIDNEIARRNLPCTGAQQQVNSQYYGGGGAASADAKITNSPSPACKGISVTRTFVGSPYGGVVGNAVRALYVTITNSSNQRKSVMLDIKIYRQGVQSPYINEPSGESWQSGGPFILRADETSLDFPIRANPGPNDRITAVNVLSCGG